VIHLALAGHRPSGRWPQLNDIQPINSKSASGTMGVMAMKTKSVMVLAVFFLSSGFVTVSTKDANAVAYCQCISYLAGCIARPGVVLRPRPIEPLRVKPFVLERPRIEAGQSIASVDTNNSILDRRS
jgi:hypothetical protein